VRDNVLYAPTIGRGHGRARDRSFPGIVQQAPKPLFSDRPEKEVEFLRISTPEHHGVLFQAASVMPQQALALAIRRS